MHTAIEKLDISITEFGLVDAFPENVKEARQRYYASMYIGDTAWEDRLVLMAHPAVLLRRQLKTWPARCVWRLESSDVDAALIAARLRLPGARSDDSAVPA
ncbi:hypothetical protein ACFYXS_05740 [Streptomyces sp. NPDC002574]|uniref:hypothetical protein n=1 Tax=Streptomyces sp. NPDC002574 TaxID=3364652 RepID=UPI003673C770